MQFRSRLVETEGVAEDLFNAVSIYMPRSLARNNIRDYTPDASKQFDVTIVTVDNYKTVMQGKLLTQWAPVFNDDTNFNITLYLIAFDSTDSSYTGGVPHNVYIMSAVRSTYFLAYFKTLFSEHYNGKEVTEGDNQYDDSNYYEQAIALAYFCKQYDSLSWFVMQSNLTPTSTDSSPATENIPRILRSTPGVETNQVQDLTSTTKVTRAQYFWGVLKNLNLDNCQVITQVEGESALFPYILGKWFETKNDTGNFVGNKLSKIKLTGSAIMPFGMPSPLNSEVRLNPGSTEAGHLDEKNVGYLLSISNASDEDSELLRDTSVTGIPCNAHMISKWINYNASQAMAKYSTDVTTLTHPVLANQETYARLQQILVNTISVFAATGRITNVQINFPPFSEAKKGNWFEGAAVWSALYVGELEGVKISGTISF